MSLVAGFDKALPAATASTMDWLINNTNLREVAFYLNPAPSNVAGQQAWTPAVRQTLANAGWSIAPLFDGQQEDVGKPWNNLTVAQGVADGDTATSEMWNAGFSLGSIIWLDVEHGQPQQNMINYIESWSAEVVKDGYTPGIYGPGSVFTYIATHSTTPTPHASAAAQWVAYYTDSQYYGINNVTNSNGHLNFPKYPMSDLASQGHANATAWQYDITPYTINTINGPFSVDLDVFTNQAPIITQVSAVSTAANQPINFSSLISVIDISHPSTPVLWAHDPDGTIESYTFRVISGGGYLTLDGQSHSGTLSASASDIANGHVAFNPGPNGGSDQLAIFAVDNIGDMSNEFDLTITVTGSSASVPIFFQNEPGGQVYFAKMNGETFNGWGAATGGLGTDWNAVTAADMNHTGDPELFVQSQSTGAIYYASHDTGTIQWTALAGTLKDAQNNSFDWKLVGVGDLNHDGNNDFVVQDQHTDTIYYGATNNGSFQAWHVVSGALKDNQNNAYDWKAVGVADINHDGYADVVIQDQKSGSIFYANMAGGAFQNWGVVAQNITTDWHVKAVADVNGDGFADVIVQNQNNGATYFANMAQGTFSGWGVVTNNIDSSWVAKDAVDINHDGRADVLFQHTTDGVTFAAEMGPNGFDHWVQVAGAIGSDWHLL